eukprot:jgi/Mesen1/7543/ME000392S06805
MLYFKKVPWSAPQAIILILALGIVVSTITVILSSSANFYQFRPLSLVKSRTLCQALAEDLNVRVSSLEQRYGFGLLRRSQGFPGDFIRAALLLQKLLSGKPLTVVALGGSVTAAGHLPDGMRLGKGTYGERIVEALNDAFPPRQQGSRHELLRTFLAGAGSFAHHFCAFDYFRALWPERDDWWRLRQADVFVVECAANDWALLQDNMTLPPGTSPLALRPHEPNAPTSIS